MTVVTLTPQYCLLFLKCNPNITYNAPVISADHVVLISTVHIVLISTDHVVLKSTDRVVLISTDHVVLMSSDHVMLISTAWAAHDNATDEIRAAAVMFSPGR